MSFGTLNRIKDYIKKTPLEYCDRLSKIYNCNVFLKREDLQVTRSFKIRGSLNKILKNKNKYNNFVCASAGNHAQGVAYSCNLLNLKSKIYVPKITPVQKINRIKNIGKKKIELIKYGENFDEAMNYGLDNIEKDELMIHPFDDMDIIDGQSTIGLEILEDIEPDIILGCVGGGGLISGLLNSVYNRKENIKIIGVEPYGSSSMYLSLKKGKITKLNKLDTFVDGASVAKVGNNTFNICKKNGLEIKRVSNNEICYNMVELYNNEGIITEPAGALSITGLNKLDRNYIKNKNIVCIVSGGNNDIMRYPEIMERSLIYLNVKHYFIIEFNQKPNELKNFVENILTRNDDITRFEYIKKTNKSYGRVLIGIETLDIDNVIHNMKLSKYKYIKLEEDNIIYNYLV